MQPRSQRYRGGVRRHYQRRIPSASRCSSPRGRPRPWCATCRPVSRASRTAAGTPCPLLCRPKRPWLVKQQQASRSAGIIWTTASSHVAISRHVLTVTDHVRALDPIALRLMLQLLAQVHHVRRAHLHLALPPPDARVRRSAGDVAVADGAELPPEIVAGFVPATPNQSALVYHYQGHNVEQISISTEKFAKRQERTL